MNPSLVQKTTISSVMGDARATTHGFGVLTAQRTPHFRQAEIAMLEQTLQEQATKDPEEMAANFSKEDWPNSRGER